MTSSTARTLVWQAASRVEQEIRAYPRVYGLFYRALTASPAVRRAVGHAKQGVRHDGSGTVASPAPPTTLAQRRREEATGRRLGLARERP